MSVELRTVEVAGATSARRPRRVMSQARQALVTGIIFLLPLLVGLAIFRGYGFIYNVWLSFNEAGAFGAPSWVGWENYHELLTDTQLRIALINTLKFALIGSIVVVVVSLVCATLMQYQGRGSGLFRTIVFLPAVLLPTAIVLVFGWMFQTQYGLVNSILRATSGQSVSWLGSSGTVTLLVTICVVYLSFSVPAVILYAGMRDISQDVFEAAALDGASKVRQFFSITLPLLGPSLFFVVLTTLIGTLKLFDVVYLLLPPEESISTNYGITIMYYYYQLAFISTGQRGYAAAVSMLLFVIILIMSLVLFRLQRRFVHFGDES